MLHQSSIVSRSKTVCVELLTWDSSCRIYDIFTLQGFVAGQDAGQKTMHRHVCIVGFSEIQFVVE